jgi:hypothetical protein
MATLLNFQLLPANNFMAAIEIQERCTPLYDEHLVRVHMSYIWFTRGLLRFAFSQKKSKINKPKPKPSRSQFGCKIFRVLGPLVWP